MSKQRRKEKHRHKKNEQLTEERKKEAEKQYEEAMKENYKQQTKATRKRMKQHGNQAQRYNENKKEFFIKRWFTKKRRSKIKKYDLK